ncbi:hypothetical protein V500_07000 [Pseudogymnoascus sp. VKM F-4518 (FW-2643)]|nr:hypothetical protein V500_07000 [Pseudogymnoascus sp. VKM F-4518 (FW-2643)]
MKKKVVATLACMLEIIGRSEELIRTKRFRHFIGVAWFGKDEKTRDALDRFHKLIDSEERLVIAVTYSSVQNTESNVGTLLSAADENKQSQKDILGKVEQLSTVVTDGKEEDLLAHALWTRAVPKTRELFADFKENLLEGTGEWLHSELLFRAWEKEEASLLWVFGGPGAGKSFLATKTILLLRDQHDQDPEHPSRVAVSYFFVKEDNQALHDLNVILKTIAYQIVQKDEIYRRYVVSACKSPEATNTAEKTWKVLFLNFYTSVQGAESSAFIVIDGLDEAPLDTRRKFLELLKVLVNQAPGDRTPRPRLQIAIFGRPDLRDDMEFSRQEKFVNVNAQKNRKDINDYILSRLPLVRVLKDMKPNARTKFAKEIRSTILQRADGMFFWAKLVLDQIYRKERKSEVQQALHNAPRELDRMIRHIFERVAADPDVNIADLNKILSWVTCAKRPLRLGEVHLILKLPTGEPNLSLRRRLRGKFASFFNMSKLEGEEEEEEEEEEVEEAVPEEKVEEAPLDFSNLSDDGDDDDDDGDDNSDYGSDDDDEDEDEDEGGQNVAPRKDEFAIDEKTKIEFRTIEISFSHKRIKDYLVQEGGSHPVFVPPEYPKMSIGIDLNESELELSLTCLAILVDGITEKEEELNLTQYAAENFMKHLGEVDRSKISKENKLKLLEQITKVFCDDAGLRKLLRATFGDDESFQNRRKNAFYHTWFGTDEHSKALRGFLGEIDNVGSNNFTDDQLEWMRLSVSSAKEFYRPLMMVASNIWLTKTGFDDEGYLDKSQLYVWVLHGYFMLHDDGSRDDDVEDFVIYNTSLSEIPLESMRTYAEWAGLKKTAHWHAGLAWIMMDGDYFDAAIAEFKKALEMDSKAWVAQEGISRCYDSLGDVNLALEWMAKATENVPTNLSFLVPQYFLPRVAPWLSKIGDSERAIKAWKEVWEYDVYKMDNLKSYIFQLHKGGRHQDLVDLIMEIRDYISGKEHCEDLLIRFLVTGHDEFDAFDAIGTSLNVVNAIDSRDTFIWSCGIAIVSADAIEAETDEPVPCTKIRMNVASFKYEYCNQTSEAVTLWQETIDLINAYAASGGRLLLNARKECTNAICQIHFDAAVEAKERGEDPGPWVDSLKDRARFSTGLIAEDDECWIYGTGYASMIYGVWLRDYDGAEEAVWKKCFQAAVVQGVDLLVDEDPDNDQVAYIALASTLLMANDIPNATAAFAIALKALEESAKKRALEEEAAARLEKGSEEQDTTDAVEESAPPSQDPDEGDGEIIDGPGDVQSVSSASSATNHHALLSSFDYVTFCDGPCDTPGSEYESLHACRIFPLPEGSEDVAVRVVDGRVEGREEWLAGLREGYAA